jgi:hypothetical protein
LLCLGGVARAGDVPAVVDGSESPWDYHLRAALGGGFDSNVRLAPVLDDAGASAPGQPPRAGVFASASAFAGVEGRLGPVSSDLEYGFLQTAYPDRRLDGSSFQMHLLEWAAEVSLAPSVRLRLPVRGDASLLGLGAGLRPFEWSAGVEPGLVVTPVRGLRIKVGVGSAEHHPLGPSYAFLDGIARVAWAAVDLGRGGWTTSLGVRTRDEIYDGSRDPAPPADGCPTCAAWLVSPYAYRATGASARLAAPWSWPVRPRLAAAVESRRYQPRLVEATGPDGSTTLAALTARRDRRATLQAALDVALTAHWSLTARYDLVDNASNLPGGTAEICAGATCVPVDQRSASYRKHSVSFELEASWL